MTIYKAGGSDPTTVRLCARDWIAIVAIITPVLVTLLGFGYGMMSSHWALTAEMRANFASVQMELKAQKEEMKQFRTDFERRVDRVEQRMDGK